jgi:iron complex transport system substrate-binding protein
MIRKPVLAILGLILFLAGCGPAATLTPVPLPTSIPTAIPTAAPTLEPTVNPAITLTDGLKRKVSLPGSAQRIVSLAPSNTEILYAIGAGTQVVGRDESSDYPSQVSSLPTVGGYSGFNTEAIVALHPDLVLAGGINTPELVASLEKLGLTVFYLSNPTTLEEMCANLETVAQLSGHVTEAAALVGSLKARIAAVDAKILPLSSRPTVYYEIDATDTTKPYTYGPGSFGDLLIQRAGGANIGSNLKGQWAQMSLEQLVVADPTIIILGDSAYGTTIDSLKQRHGWEGLDALKNNQVFPFDDNLVSRPGPRLVDGLEALAKLLHPGVFK